MPDFAEHLEQMVRKLDTPPPTPQAKEEGQAGIRALHEEVRQLRRELEEMRTQIRKGDR